MGSATSQQNRYDDVFACMKDKQYDLVLEHLNDFQKRFTSVCVRSFGFIRSNILILEQKRSMYKIWK